MKTNHKLAVGFGLLAILGGAGWYLAPKLAALLSACLNLDEQKLSLLDHWISILSGLTSMAATVCALAAFLWRHPQSRNPPPSFPTPHSPSLSRNLTPHYYRELNRQCERLLLDTIDPASGDSQIGLKLSNIYQDQHVYLSDSDTRGGHRLAEMREALPLLLALSKVEKRRLFIRGKLGAGKSSFINYLAHRIVQSRVDGSATNLPSSMLNRPVARLQLRKLGADLKEDKATHGLIWEEIQKEARSLIDLDLKASGGQPPSQDSEFTNFWETFHEQLRRQGILLLDGLDEVSEAEGRRKCLRTAIIDFIDNTPDVFVIVTGRPYTDEQPEQQLAEFQRADLAPMTPIQIRAFIQNWYEEDSRVRGKDSQDAQNHAGLLANYILSDRNLSDMATNALLLTLFIVLNCNSKGKPGKGAVALPSSRPKLYEEAVDLLLKRWHDQLKPFTAGLDSAEKDGMTKLETSVIPVRQALAKLAFDSYKDLTPATGGSPVSALEFRGALARGILGDFFQAETVKDQGHFQQFLQYRSGLLMPGGEEDNFQFVHKSFHEYLAACHLLQNTPKSQKKSEWKNELQELLRNNLDWWREVFLLLVKKYSDDQYDDAVLFLHHQLLGSYPATGHADAYQQRLLLLAATAALELAIQDRQQEHDIYRQFHHFLQTELAGLLHSPHLAIAERAEAGRLLSELGDPRPGVTVQRANGQAIKRQRKGKEHELPDIDWQPIPAGRFRMGTEGEEGYDDEKPAHDVELPGFYISRYPVTNAQYRCFVKAGLYEDRDFWEKLPEAARQWWKGEEAVEKLLQTLPEKVRDVYRSGLNRDSERRRPRFWEDKQWNLDNHPVVGVSWFEALAYSVWLDDELKDAVKPAEASDGLRIRLPTEAEWEYAARGDRNLRYAWGGEADANLGNYADTGLQRTSAVGLFPAGAAVDKDGKPFGLHDMSGNAWEWTLSRWGTDGGKPDFTYSDWQKQDQKRNHLKPVEFRVARGGSWDGHAGDVRCAVRNGFLPDYRIINLGFRLLCVEVLPGRLLNSGF